MVENILARRISEGAFTKRKAPEPTEFRGLTVICDAGISKRPRSRELVEGGKTKNPALQTVPTYFVTKSLRRTELTPLYRGKRNPGEIRAGVPYKRLRLHPTAARRLRQVSRSWLPLHTGPPPSARTTPLLAGYQNGPSGL